MPPTIVEGSDPFPAAVGDILGVSCLDSTLNLMPKLALKAGVNPILLGDYIFDMAVTNPTLLYTTPGKWTFGTYTNVDDHPGTGAVSVDLGMEAPGFVVNDIMAEVCD